MKKLIILLVVFNLLSTPVLAANPHIQKPGGDQVGNGTDDPILALTPEQKEVLEKGFNLDYLKLDARGIKARDKSLAPIYRSYENNRVSNVLKAIQTTFGTNLYHHVKGQEIDFGLNSKVNKPMVMAAAARAFIDTRSCGSQYYDGCQELQSPFRTAAESEVGYLNSVELESGKITTTRIRGKKDTFSETSEYSSLYALLTQESSASKDRMFGLFYTTIEGLYSSTSNNLFTTPGVLHFLEALKESNLKGLDATVVFTNNNMRAETKLREVCRYERISTNNYTADELRAWAKSNNIDAIEDYLSAVQSGELERKNTKFQRYTLHSWRTNSGIYTTVSTNTCEMQPYRPDLAYHVVYPTFSRLAPIPQPVIYLNVNAPKAEMTKLIAEHAPRIYAYNKLFDQNVLPAVADLNSVLEEYPGLLEDVERLAGKVDRENFKAAVQQAFLTVAYGAGLTIGVPLTLGAMLLSPLYYPILVKTVVIILL